MDFYRVGSDIVDTVVVYCSAWRKLKETQGIKLRENSVPLFESGFRVYPGVYSNPLPYMEADFLPQELYLPDYSYTGGSDGFGFIDFLAICVLIVGLIVILMF